MEDFVSTTGVTSASLTPEVKFLQIFLSVSFLHFHQYPLCRVAKSCRWYSSFIPDFDHFYMLWGGGLTLRGRLPGLPNQVTNSPGLNFAMQTFQRGVTQLAGIRFILPVNNPEKVYPGICVGNLIFI